MFMLFYSFFCSYTNNRFLPIHLAAQPANKCGGVNFLCYFVAHAWQFYLTAIEKNENVDDDDYDDKKKATLN